jgi:hypothetical protein
MDGWIWGSTCELTTATAYCLLLTAYYMVFQMVLNMPTGTVSHIWPRNIHAC